MSETLRPVTISLHALGGQGGGVVADWVIDAARAAGWIAQATSVPGVAQRTGATVYYIELFRLPGAGAPEPVLALMPTPGDVDVVAASELMEAGRAFMRGLVTDRTTVIASTSRVYAVSEKSAMSDGRLGGEDVLSAIEARARRLIAFDMEQVASDTGSVISSVVLGAIAGAGVLPFDREHFEQAIRNSGIAVNTNLVAFAAGFEGAGTQRKAQGTRHLPQTADVIAIGTARAADYQDAAYAVLYRERVQAIAAFEKGGDERLTRTVAQHLALWMTYEDTVRVAELKVRGTRLARVREEVSAKPGQIVEVTEYLHPRIQEMCEAMPAKLGKWALENPAMQRLLGRFAKGRHVRSTGLGGFLLLYCLAAQKGWRRRTLRYVLENAKIESWLRAIAETAATDYDKAVEIAACQSLIKGYGDTYERGWDNFERIMAALPQLDAVGVAMLRRAALADEKGTALCDAMERLGSTSRHAA
jgi:indolepyruvate ferredoxin oxidoreductase beta subunit